MVTPSRVPKPSAINCPNCGGNIELRGFAHTRSAVCVQCCSIIDPTTPDLRILQQFDERMRVRPLIPLGTRGKYRGIPYEVIGFQVRSINSDGVEYSWHEYLLFNPFKGFRYLTQYVNELFLEKGFDLITKGHVDSPRHLSIRQPVDGCSRNRTSRGRSSSTLLPIS